MNLSVIVFSQGYISISPSRFKVSPANDSWVIYFIYCDIRLLDFIRLLVEEQQLQNRKSFRVLIITSCLALYVNLVHKFNM